MKMFVSFRYMAGFFEGSYKLKCTEMFYVIIVYFYPELIAFTGNVIALFINFIKMF